MLKAFSAAPNVMFRSATISEDDSRTHNSWHISIGSDAMGLPIVAAISKLASSPVPACRNFPRSSAVLMTMRGISALI